MREPPGVPITMVGRPSFTRMVGDIDDSGRLPGATALASEPITPKMLGWPGTVAKSSISSLSAKPAPRTTTPQP